MRRKLAYCLSLCAAASAFAQVDAQMTAAQPAGPTLDGARRPGAAGPSARAPRAMTPDTAVDAFQLPDTRNEGGGGFSDQDTGSLQFAGYVEDAPDALRALLAAATPMPAPDGGLVYAVELTSPGAEALRVQFNESFGRDGLELWVYDPATGMGFGPYTRPVLDEFGGWWTTIIFGESIGLEFRLPPGEPDALRVPPISKIAYNYGQPGAVIDRGCSHRDVSCEAAWQDEADAVTMLSVITGGGNVSGYCSGALINRNNSDFTPLVLTANHCIGGNGGQSTANSTVFVWFFQTPSCNGAAPNPNNLPRSDGSLLVKRHTGSDWNLVGLYEDADANFFLGWDANFWADNSSATGIHHPGGTFKRISFGTQFGDDNRTFCDSNGQNCFNADVWNVDYTTGFTQPGSSGSPVMDSSARVRGTLTGGPADDCTISRYGRFDLAFANVRYFLFDLANPCYVDFGVAGDSINNGNSERGTAGNPFNSVYESTFAVPASGTVRIRPGTYNERFTLRKPMTLIPNTPGAVRIGG